MRTKTVALSGIKSGPKDGLAEGEFIGYASVFGNKDSYGDIVEPGAFDDTLAEWAAKNDPIPVLWGHNMSDPDYNIGHVITPSVDEKGLKVHVKLDIDDPLPGSKAPQAHRLLKGGRVSQMSFAYDVLDGGYAERTDTAGGEKESYYALRKLHLYEVSVVPIGANQETEILGVKSAAQIADRIVMDIKAGRAISAKNESELRTAYESLGRVLSALDTDEEKTSGHTDIKDEGGDVKSEGEGLNPSVKSLAQLEAMELESQFVA
jgi:HK97 family phage prohead protease